MKVLSIIQSTIIKCIKIAILSILLSAIVFQAPYVHKAYIRNIAENSAVQIFGENGSGSGSHVKLPNGKVVILTNKHVCKMKGPLMIKAEDTVLPIERKIISISVSHDLCAIEALPEHSGISIGSDPKIGDELYTLGHPRGEALNVAKGEYFDNRVIEIAEEVNPDGSCSEGLPQTMITFFGPIQLCVVKRNTIQVSSPTYPGNSGSPVVDKYGKLVAVIFAGNASVENNGFAVPLFYVKEFLNSIK